MPEASEPSTIDRASLRLRREQLAMRAMQIMQRDLSKERSVERVADELGVAAHDAATGDLPNTNPLLAPLADNGGPTPTHALLEGSPAIDGGKSIRLTDRRGFVSPIDLAGVVNAVGGNGSDIGGFEAFSFAPIPGDYAVWRDNLGATAKPPIATLSLVSYASAEAAPTDSASQTTATRSGTFMGLSLTSPDPVESNALSTPTARPRMQPTVLPVDAWFEQLGADGPLRCIGLPRLHSLFGPELELNGVWDQSAIDLEDDVPSLPLVEIELRRMAGDL